MNGSELNSRTHSLFPLSLCSAHPHRDRKSETDDGPRVGIPGSVMLFGSFYEPVLVSLAHYTGRICCFVSNWLFLSCHLFMKLTFFVYFWVLKAQAKAEKGDKTGSFYFTVWLLWSLRVSDITSKLAIQASLHQLWTGLFLTNSLNPINHKRSWERVSSNSI